MSDPLIAVSLLWCEVWNQFSFPNGHTVVPASFSMIDMGVRYSIFITH